MRRDQLIDQVRTVLDGRDLVFFGTRGDDVAGLADLPELSSVFSVIAPYRQRSSVRSMALEEISGRRVDLDAHDIDDDPRDPSVTELRQAMLRSLNRPSVVLTYRPSRFLSSICFAREEHVQYAGLFVEHQAAFEHKPWVESEISRLGVPMIPWTYIADEEQLLTLDAMADGPVIVRRSKSSGGTGLTRVDRSADLAAAWPAQDEAFASIAPYFAEGIATNVSAVVWRDGVTLHHPSVQIIGVPECTARPFGYCGNDFGAATTLSAEALASMESSTLKIAGWLKDRGYRGAFGVDFLVVDGIPLFTEVNPRLQGVTHASCQLAVEHDESCVLLEHLASSLDLPAPPSHHLADLARRPPAAHLVCHHLGSTPQRVDGNIVVDRVRRDVELRRVDVVASGDVEVEPHATLARMTTFEQITVDGRSLDPAWAIRLATAITAPELTS